MKSQILKLRKKIYENLKLKASSYESRSPELINYYNDQEIFSKRDFQICKLDQVKNKVSETDIFFIGDFHTFDQNIRNVLRILKYIINAKDECIIGLEMVHAKFQLELDAFMDGHITELEFLELINYHNSWRFPWTHYKLIFDLAKENKIKVKALNSNGSLEQRDQHSSEIINSVYTTNFEIKLLVLYGELHITPDKIPRLINEKLPNKNVMILHQNLDEVYWKLIENGKEQGIVSFNENEFCIVSAPPWIKYESMIYWFENLCDDPDFDIHEYIIEKGKKIFSEDTSENFFNICSDLISYLELDIDVDEVEDFNLYDHTNLEFIQKKLKINLKESLCSFYEYLISTNRSFRLPTNATFYCSSYSMNRISYLAGIHIFHFILNEESYKALDILNSKSSQSKFILFTLENMYGYFFSKIINPHRKCDMYKDLKRKLNNTQLKPDEIKVLKSALNIIDTDQLTENLKGFSLNLIFESSIHVGHILGEFLYLSLSEQKKNMLDNEHIKNFKLNQNNFIKLKHSLLQDRNYKDISKRYF